MYPIKETIQTHYEFKIIWRKLISTSVVVFFNKPPFLKRSPTMNFYPLFYTKLFMTPLNSFLKNTIYSLTLKEGCLAYHSKLNVIMQSW